MKNRDQHRDHENHVNEHEDGNLFLWHQLSFRKSLWIREQLETHDVVTAVHVNCLTRDSRTEIGSQVHRCVTNFARINVAL